MFLSQIKHGRNAKNAGKYGGQLSVILANCSGTQRWLIVCVDLSEYVGAEFTITETGTEMAIRCLCCKRDTFDLRAADCSSVSHLRYLKNSFSVVTPLCNLTGTQLFSAGGFVG